jgi:flagellar biosynthesis protein FlhB
MEDSSAQDRQLPATQRKIEKARSEGQVARSRDLAHLVVLGGGLALVALLAPELVAWCKGLLRTGLRFDAASVARPDAMTEHLGHLARLMLAALLPFGALMLVATGGAAVLCGGWNFTLKPLQPKFEKINPLTGLARLVGLQQLGDTLKSCLLAVVLGTVGALFVAAQIPQFMQLLAMPLPAALATGGGHLQTGLMLLGGVLLAFALVDVPLQRQLLLRRLRMDITELKKETRESEGNAEVKGKVKLRMREMASRRMLAAVPRADLVVMNPTHFAVALRYDEAAMGAPRVVAKGADLLALRIRDLAKDAGVPVLQAPPLARALYTHCELDQEIPARLFAAVAQVLAWVYQLRQATAVGQHLDTPAPQPVVPADLDPAAPRRDPEL